MRYFNPRSPCGERPFPHIRAASSTIFQSTLPVWGATWKPGADEPVKEFQSTLPVWGATAGILHQNRPGMYFNPRSPCGERQLQDAYKDTQNKNISIHAPRVGSDAASFGNREGDCLRRFQSTLPVWGATAKIPKDIPEKAC